MKAIQASLLSHSDLGFFWYKLSTKTPTTSLRGIDYAVANNEISGRAPDLPYLIKEVCQRKNESQLQATIMVLMISVKDKDLAGWSVLDVGTGNGLLLQDLAKQGFSDLIGIDYSEGAINLARSLANRDEFIGIKLLVDDVLETKLEKTFELVME
ncbi:unnamed protein product [Lactuca virosa]|uniref:Methyltransferase domain-containing protein n=1 Tax=Lactuca virosa TaxID=75947 RepID=A0AAU9P4E5_9ASTR|nr:unnamed protein product [Lactuca virosa]